MVRGHAEVRTCTFVASMFDNATPATVVAQPAQGVVVPRDLNREVRVNWILTGICAAGWLTVLVLTPDDLDGLIWLGAFTALMALLSWYHAHQVKRGRQPWGVRWEKLRPFVAASFAIGLTVVVVVVLWGIAARG
jgi:hypothetical protein